MLLLGVLTRGCFGKVWDILHRGQAELDWVLAK